MAPLATVGILSCGSMGTAVGKLLVQSGFRVVTNITGRSEDTKIRAQKAAIDFLPTDTDLVKTADYILSIVPPRDAESTASRIITALQNTPPRETPLYYLDLNAVSPRSVRAIAELFISSASPVRFLDCAIIGEPPSPKSADASAKPDEPSSSHVAGFSSSPPSNHPWKRPSIPMCGPYKLEDAPVAGAQLAESLGSYHISEEIGTVSGLKMCFATTTKGFIALAIQAFTTAERLGVLGELKKEMGERVPDLFKAAEKGVCAMPPKAYRWVGEMAEIAETHDVDGGFEGGGKGIFEGVKEVYRVVAEDTVLGKEKTERRERGLTSEDVARGMWEGMEEKKMKKE